MTEEAAERGAFGAPTMFFCQGGAGPVEGEQMFWGSDRSLTTVKAQSVHKYYLSAATAAAPTCGLRCGAEGGSWECFTLRPLPVQGLLFLQFIFKSFLIKSFNLKSNYLTTTTSQATGFCF